MNTAAIAHKIHSLLAFGFGFSSTNFFSCVKVNSYLRLWVCEFLMIAWSCKREVICR